MAPFLFAGDRIGVDWFTQDRIGTPVSQGDVVVVRTTDQWVVHRVVALSPLRTKGDNNYFFDQFAFKDRQNAVFGKVVAVCRRDPSGVRDFVWIKNGWKSRLTAQLSLTTAYAPRGVRKLIKGVMRWMLPR